ncbi:MAG: hypothetical protein F4X69_02570 [Gemmatimonadetes bacterium]|nr:hypothetical protein [Gemmatimonadota bacterium]
MTRWISIVVTALLTVSCNTLGDPTDVRNVRWGMSMAQVKETEASPVAKELTDVSLRSQSLIYHDNIAGEFVKIQYWFTGNELDAVTMTYENIEDEGYAVELGKLLGDKYGPAIEENPEQTEADHRKWVTPRTTIHYQFRVNIEHIREFQIETNSLRIHYEPTRDLKNARDLF